MFHAKKSLGQNFLKSKQALRDIVNAGKVSDNDTVLEIGPGMGVLTQVLLDTGANVIAIEKDDRLIEKLEETFTDYIQRRQLTIIHGDALEFDPACLHASHKLQDSKLHKNPDKTKERAQRDVFNYKLIANIPYYITGEIIQKFLSTEYQPSAMVLLVQKEVAERIVTRDKKESILSLSVKAYGTPKYISTVKKQYFSPQPKVDSAIIAIENITPLSSSQKQNSGKDNKKFESHFFNVIKTGFAHKRKKVLSNLKEKFDVSSLNIPENTRAEELGIERWLEIAEKL